MDAETDFLIRDEDLEYETDKLGVVEPKNNTEKYSEEIKDYSPRPLKILRKTSRVFAFICMTTSVFFHIFASSYITIDVLLVLNCTNWLFKSRHDQHWTEPGVFVEDLVAVVVSIMLLLITYIPTIISFVSTAITIFCTKKKRTKLSTEIKMSRISFILSVLSAIFYFIFSLIGLIILVVLLFANATGIGNKSGHFIGYMKMLSLIVMLIAVSSFVHGVSVFPYIGYHIAALKADVK